MKWCESVNYDRPHRHGTSPVDRTLIRDCGQTRDIDSAEVTVAVVFLALFLFAQ